jgi:hypothetical protein
MFEKLIKCETDVFGNLTEQDGGDISALMKRNRCATACCITELLVRSALAYLGETEFDKNGDNFIGFEDRNIAHESSDSDVLHPNKLGLQHRLTVFQKHCNDIVQIMIDLIQRFSLGVGAGEAGHETNEQTGLCASLNYR